MDKSTEEAIKRATAGPADREIVDYADFFPSKKPKPATDVVTTNKPPVTAEPIRRLARGPPKVRLSGRFSFKMIFYSSIKNLQSNFGCLNSPVSNTMDRWNLFVSPVNFSIHLM